MKIIEHRALRGPNFYNRYLTIFMQLDIEDLEDRPSDTVEGIVDRLLSLIPSLEEHRCSVGRPGGFIERVGRGTWAGHIVEHVAIELQNLSGFSVGFGRTLDTEQVGVYNVLYRYRDEATALAAGREAMDFVEQLFNHREIDTPAILRRLAAVRDEHKLGPSTASIVEAARRRDIPLFRPREGTSYVQLGYGCRQQRIQATITGRTALLGSGIADDKDWTKQMLADAGIPVPRGFVCETFDEALTVSAEIGYPVVVKPLIGNHGRGVTTGVDNARTLRLAWDEASKRYDNVIVEEHIGAEDYRLLMIGNRLVAAAHRQRAHVTGDGISTLRELVDKTNADPKRGDGHENLLTKISIDNQTIRLIAQQGWTLKSRIPAGEVVYLKATANISTGGTATDVTDHVHPELRFTAERIARLTGLDILGIDILAETLKQPLNQQNARVVEVNAGPGFRMHTAPTHGEGRDVGAHVVDMLFPEGANGRIPITAVTGTNGKTTTVRLINHLLRQAGQHVGMATTAGIEIDGHPVMHGDYSGPAGAGIVLREPTVEQAVLEVARGGIMRRGLGFDACDVGVLLNISSDHLGEYELNTLDDMARCKTVILDAIPQTGTAVLNADDALVMENRDWARCNIIMFSLDPQSRIVQRHVREQGTAFTVHNGNIVMREGRRESRIVPVADVPLTYEGRAYFNIANALAGAAAAHALGFTAAEIRSGLETFHPSPEQNPGRTNLIEADGIRVLIDYAHNVAALQSIEEFVHALPANRLLVVASAPGNRRDEDLIALGAQLGRMAHHLFLCDTDPRHRLPGEIPALLKKGAQLAGNDSCGIELLLDERIAVDRAFETATEGDLLLLLIDDVEEALEQIRERTYGKTIADDASLHDSTGRTFPADFHNPEDGKPDRRTTISSISD